MGCNKEKDKTKQEEARDEVRERVELELNELLDKISNLTKFLYGKGVLKANISDRMKECLYFQLEHMKQYAYYLQSRLRIWGKSDKEIEEMERKK